MRASIVAVAAVASLVIARPRPSVAQPGPAPAASAESAPASSSPWTDDGARVPALAPGGFHLDEPTDRRALSLGILGGVYVAFSTWAYYAWYYDKPDLPAFTVGGDGYFGQRTYAGGADKLGHAWANHALSRSTTELLRWGGWSRGQASALASGLSWMLFLFVEIKDGYYYQLSPGDLIGNSAGAALSALMVNLPAFDDAVDFKVEFWPSPEYRHEFLDGNVNVAEDYSGQTYYLALHLAAVRPRGVPPLVAGALDYLDVGVGYQTRRYKPDPPDGEPRGVRRQELFVGATLDLQRIVDRFGGRRSRAARVSRAIGHGLLEVFAPPFSVVPVAGIERSPDR